MKIKFFLFFILLAATFNTPAQNGKDSLVYEYAILRHEKRLVGSHVDVSFSNNKYIDLKKELQLETTPTIPYIDYQEIFSGINYLEKLGYALISSSSYGTTYPMREYLFRKKLNK